MEKLLGAILSSPKRGDLNTFQKVILLQPTVAGENRIKKVARECLATSYGLQ